MSAKKIAGTIINVSLEIILLALVVIVIYNCGLKAYAFGFSVFNEQPVAREPGRDISVTIDSGSSTYDIAKLLESKGLIRDENVFFVQMKLSAKSGKVKPGEYTLNNSMSSEKLIEAITREDSEEDEEEEQP